MDKNQKKVIIENEKLKATRKTKKFLDSNIGILTFFIFDIIVDWILDTCFDITTSGINSDATNKSKIKKLPFWKEFLIKFFIAAIVLFFIYLQIKFFDN